MQQKYDPRSLDAIERIFMRVPGDSGGVERLREAIRQAEKVQTKPCAVAPGAAFTTPITQLPVSAGDEILIPIDMTLQQALALQSREVVILLSEERQRALKALATPAKYRVGRGQALMLRERGILIEGEGVTPEELEGGLTRIKELIERNVLVDTAPEVPA